MNLYISGEKFKCLANRGQESEKIQVSHICIMYMFVVEITSYEIYRDSKIAVSCLRYPLKLKRDSSATNYLCFLKMYCGILYE